MAITLYLQKQAKVRKRTKKTRGVSLNFQVNKQDQIKHRVEKDKKLIISAPIKTEK